VQRFAAQIEEAVLQPDVFGIRLFIGHRHRKLFRRALHRHAAREDLDLAGGKARIDRPGRARLHCALDGDDALDPEPFQNGKRRAVGIGHDLRDPVMIAQIDKQHAPVVALAVNPARQTDGLTHMIGRKLCASMRAVGVHLNSCPVRGYDARARGRIDRSLAPPSAR